MSEIICSLEMQHLQKAGECSNNSSGVKTLYFALRKDVAILPTLPNTRNSFEDFALLSEGGVTAGSKAHSIEMKPNKYFFQFYTGKDLAELKYSTQGVPGGKSMSATLEVTHPGLKKHILGFVASTMNSEFILLVKLNNGDIHMLGDKERGAEFGDSVEATSGKTISDQNGVTINFTYDTPTAQIYIGDIDTLLASEGSGNGS